MIKIKCNKNLQASFDTDLAAALVAEGEALAATKNYRQVLQCYLAAAAIFSNRYKENMQYSQEVNQLFGKIISTAKNLPDYALFNKFKAKQAKLFSAKNSMSVKTLVIDSAS